MQKNKNIRQTLIILIKGNTPEKNEIFMLGFGSIKSKQNKFFVNTYFAND